MPWWPPTPRTGAASTSRCNAAPLREDDDTVCGAVVLIQNVTMETAARAEQEELRHRLVDTVNHEFRTPLTKLVGHMEILTDLAEQLPAPARHSVSVAHQAATELRDLIQVVSGLADLGSHAKLRLTYGNLAGLLRDVATQFAPVLAARGIVLAAEFPDRVTGTLDPEEVTRAVVELLANAAQFAPAGSQVRLGLTVVHQSVEVSVVDEGSGIAHADRDRLVQPFERGAHPASRSLLMAKPEVG